MILKSVDNDDQDDAEDDNDDDSVAMTMRMVDRVDAAWRRRFNETLKGSQVVSSHSNVSVSNISSHSNVYAKISIALSLQKCAFQAMLTIHPLQ